MASVPKLEDGAAIAVVTFTVIEVFNVYRNTAPKLTDVRKSRNDDWLCAQQILDADVLSGILVAVMGIAAAVLMRKTYPLVFLIISWALISGYYHAVKNGPSKWEEIGA